MMQRTIVYKLKPTARQAGELERYLRVTRAVYNAALEQRIAAWDRGEHRSWVDQSRELAEVRQAGLLEGCHVHAVQLALRRLERAYDGFFARCRADARRKGFPRFKSGRYWRSFAFKEHGNGWRIAGDGRRLRITGVGQVRVRAHRPLPGIPKTLSVVRKADGWYAHVVCQPADVPAVPDTNPGFRAALDLGVEALATLHTGQRVANIRAGAHARMKLTGEQRALARCRRGSNRRRKQAHRVALAHLKLARVRRDHLHKQTSLLAEQYRYIAVEDLTITAMSSTARGTIEQPGRRVRQKAGLNRSILDAGWGEFLSLLEYKLQAHGGGLIRVDPRGTSQQCSGCGQRVQKALSEREHHCPHCGLVVHRDHNAAVNIHQRAWAVPVAEAA
jgi:putative transposase